MSKISEPGYLFIHSGILENYQIEECLKDSVKFLSENFDSDFKTALLQGNTLFPYYGMIPKPHASEGNDARSRIFVITTNKIFKFDTSNVVYFNSVKNSIKHYIASEFFTARGDAGDSTYSSNAVTNGQTTYNQGVD